MPVKRQQFVDDSLASEHVLLQESFWPAGGEILTGLSAEAL
jgi:hypothetical protein